MAAEDLSSMLLDSTATGGAPRSKSRPRPDLILYTQYDSNGHCSTSNHSAEWFRREIANKKNQNYEAEKVLTRVEHEHSKLTMLLR